MRILLANPYFLPYRGGIERRLDGQARELARQGHEVAVLCARLPGTSARQRDDGYEILRCPSFVWSSFPYNPAPLLSRRVLETAASFSPDVVDFHYRWAPDWTRAMRRASARVPLVVTWHNVFGEGSGVLGRVSRANDRRYLRFARSHARAIACVSEHVRRELADEGAPASQLVTLPMLGVDGPP
ncbi:MAG TPA: glycosyltransferase family 4 protein, partial [Candidatus Thermoplasmatota archaeon]|nr:glycosyltransferase family 4 protein [Candidatus Thermoplasmatota archaeon]